MSEREVQEAMDEMEQNRDLVCEYAGHEWEDAGGGLLICAECLAEKWEGDRD